MHTFYGKKFCICRLGFVNRYDSVFADDFHSFGDILADCVVCGRYACHLAYCLGRVDGFRDCFQFFDHCVCNLGDTFFEYHRICACGYVFKSFFDYCLRKYASGGRAVSGNVVGLDRHFFDKLRAHIFKSVFKFDFFCYRYAVVGDKWRAVFFVKYDVASLRSNSNFDCVGNCVYACLQTSSGVFAIFKFLRHIKLLYYVRLFNCIILLRSQVRRFVSKS